LKERSGDKSRPQLRQFDGNLRAQARLLDSAEYLQIVICNLPRFFRILDVFAEVREYGADLYLHEVAVPLAWRRRMFHRA